MDNGSIEPQPAKYTNPYMMKEILEIFILGIFAAALLSIILQAHTVEFHNISELICLSMALSIFFVITYSKEQNPDVNVMLGYGFLIAAVFRIFHIYYYLPYGSTASGYVDLSTQYSIIARFTEACMFLVGLKPGKPLKISIPVGTFLTIGPAFICSYVLLYFPLPGVNRNTGVNFIVNIFELLIVLLYIYGLIRINRSANKSESLTYKYISLAICTAIISQICIVMPAYNNLFFFALGHIYRVIYYFCLLKGIVVSSIVYPYRELQSSVKNNEDILNNLKRGIIVCNMNRRITFVNRPAEEMLNCSRDELLGLPLYGVMDKFNVDDGNAGKAFINNQDVYGAQLSNDIKTFRLKNNDIVKIQIGVSSLSSGSCIMTLERAEDEQALENLQLQTQTILDSINSLILIFDKNKRIVMCNKAMENLTGIPSQSVVGMDIGRLNAMLHYELKNSSPGQDAGNMVEARITTLNGNVREILYHFAPIYNVNAEFMGNIYIASDITGMNEERQKLQRQEKFALIGQISSGIVHDIKNPLAVIKGFSQVISSTAGDKKIREYAQMMESASDEISRVVSDFLSFSKPQPAAISEVSVGSLLRSVRFLMESYMIIKGINSRFGSDSSDMYIMIDEGKIKEVLLNIIGNAIDALEGVKEPGIEVSARCNEALQEVSIYVSDNGKGIPPENIKKIGTPFFTTKKNGTGLGLSMCYKIVGDFSGRIDVESETGKGATFIISLPGKCKSQPDNGSQVKELP